MPLEAATKPQKKKILMSMAKEELREFFVIRADIVCSESKHLFTP